MKRKNKKKLYTILLIVGLVSAIAYLISILYLWTNANYNDYIYFRGGEPNPFIKYPEWLLGIIALFSLLVLLKEKADEL